MSSDQHSPTIYTAGYAKLRDPARLLDLARHFNALVIDVRLKPYTSFTGWSRGELQDYFGERYRWVEWLGNVNYGGGPVQLRDADYGLQLVAPILQKQSVILLCGCADLRQCHRREVAHLLAEATGCPVEHWSDPPPTDPDAPQQLSLF